MFNHGLTIRDCLFKNNSADLSGGALFLQDVDGNIQGNTFIGNAALNTSGGAIDVRCSPHNNAPCKMVIMNNTF